MNGRALALTALAGLVGVLGFGILTAKPPPSQKRQLVIWGIQLGLDTKGREAVIREFERRNPDVEIKLTAMGAGRMDPQKLMTSIAGNVAPDVVDQDRFTTADWASRGAFRSLDDLIARDRDRDPNCPTPDKFYPAGWNEAVFQGKLYALPTALDSRILWWNKAYFREKSAELRAAGCDPERPPRTWSELLRYSKALTEYHPNGSLKRVGFMPNFGNAWLYLYAFQTNASFISEDGRRCTLASPEAVEALEFMVKAYDLIGGYEKARSFESGFLTRENDPFVQGRVAMKVDGDWVLYQLARYGPGIDLGSAPPPVPDDRYHRRGRYAGEPHQFVTWSGGSSMAIPTGAKNVDDAWEFIKFITSAEGVLLESRVNAEWARSKGRPFIPRLFGNIPGNEAVHRELRPREPKFAAAIDTAIEMARYARTRPPTFVGQILWSKHVDAMESALYHRDTPEGALKKSQITVQRELDAYFTKEQYPVVDLGFAVYVSVAAGLGAIGWIYWTYQRSRLGRVGRREARWAYLFVSPTVFGLLLFSLGPMIASLCISFTQYDVLNDARWVGARNYVEMTGVDKPTVLKALANALYLGGIGVPLAMVTGLAVALLLNSATRGINTYRALFYMPAIVPTVASAVIWSWVLNPSPDRGLINDIWSRTLLPWLGAPPPTWLASAAWSKDALILMGLWGAGSGMILWLAGLKGIPTTLYEAAGIDGANSRQQFWSVTFPQLSPIIFFSLVIGFIGAVQEFDRAYILRPSVDGPVGPDDSMLTPVFHLFRSGFMYFKMGYASALAWGLFALILVLTYIQFKLAPRWVKYEVED